VEEFGIRLAGLIDHTPGQLHADLAADPRNLNRLVRHLLLDAPPEIDLLVVIDQFEEIFTQCEDPQERTSFIAMLLIAAGGPDSRLRVVLGVRSDFYPHCARHPDLVEALDNGQVLLGAMTVEEFRRAITRPAMTVGCTVETALLSQLIADAGGRAGTLPLVSHALLETWRRRRGNTLTLAGYQAAGGIRSALARTAEAVHATLSPPQQALAKQVLLRLTTVGEGTEDTKRRADRTELTGLDGDLDPVLHALAGARLLTLDNNMVTITHEALFHAWPRLRGWIEEDRQGLRVQRHLTDATAIWEDLDHDPGALYRTTRLATTLQWLRREKPALTIRERDFLDHSIATEATTHRTARRRRRALAAAVVILLMVATAIAVPVVRQRQEAHRVDVSRTLATAATDNITEARRNSLLALDTHSTVEARSSLLRAAVTRQSDHRSIPTTFRQLNGLALSPTGDLVAEVEGNGLTVWNTATLRAIATATAEIGTRFTEAIAFSPDGTTLATGDSNGSITLWRLPDGTQTGTIDTGLPAVFDLVFSPDGHSLVVNDWDRGVSLWDIAERRKLAEPRLRTRQQTSLTISADGHVLAAPGRPGTIDLWDRRSLSHIAELPVDGGAVFDLAFAPTGALLAMGDEFGAVTVWDTESRSKVATVGRHSGGAYGVAFSPDGTLLASTGEDGRLALWDVVNHIALPDLPIENVKSPEPGEPTGLWDVTFGRDGTLVAASGSDILLWTVDQLPSKSWDGVEGLAFDKNDDLLVLNDTGLLATWTTIPGLRRATDRNLAGTGSGKVAGVFSDDGTRLAVAAPGQLISVWDTGGHDEVILRLPDRPDPATPRMMTITADPPTVMVVDRDPNRPFALWDVRRPGEPTLIHEIPDRLTGIAFLPRTHLVALGGLDGEVKIVDPSTGDEVTILKGHGGPVTAIAATPDGRLLATTGVDSAVILWDTVTWRQVARMDGHTGQAWEAVMSPDGRMLATGSADGTIIVWDIATHTRWATLSGQTGPVQALAWNSSSTMLASAGAHSTISLWHTDLNSAIRTVCDRLMGKKPLPPNCSSNR
jgi:WD40 repeat protein